MFFEVGVEVEQASVLALRQSPNVLRLDVAATCDACEHSCREIFLQDVVLSTFCCASKKNASSLLGPLHLYTCAELAPGQWGFKPYLHTTRSLQRNNDTQAYSNLSEHPSLSAPGEERNMQRSALSISLCSELEELAVVLVACRQYTCVPLLVSDLLRHSAGCHDMLSTLTRSLLGMICSFNESRHYSRIELALNCQQQTEPHHAVCREIHKMMNGQTLYIFGMTQEIFRDRATKERF